MWRKEGSGGGCISEDVQKRVRGKWGCEIAVTEYQYDEMSVLEVKGSFLLRRINGEEEI